MKGPLLRIAALALAAIALSAFNSPAQAHDSASGHAVIIGADRIVNEDLDAVGNTVEVKARIKGDLNAAGSNVIVSGPVEGDILAAGGTVSLDGTIGDDARAVGGTVIVKSPIKDNALIAGGTVIVQPSARVGHDAKIAGGNVRVQAAVGRNLNLAAGQATLSSVIGGSALVYADQLTLEPGAVVRGDLLVRSPKPPIVSPDAKVLGRLDYEKTEAQGNRGATAGSVFGDWLVRSLWLFVLGTAALALSRRWTDQIVDKIEHRLGRSLLAGFFGVIALPVLVIVLLITVIGAPLGILLLALYAAALMMSGVFVGYEMGSWLFQKLGRPDVSPFARLALGAAMVPLLTMLPGVGWLIGLVIVMLGVGALLLERSDLFLQRRAPSQA